MTVFEIEYVDRQSGEVVTKTVTELKLAQSIARELAMANGRRAIIRRRSTDRWAVVYVDLVDGRVVRLEGSLSKHEAVLTWKRWDARTEQSALVLWPAWAEGPEIRVKAS